MAGSTFTVGGLMSNIGVTPGLAEQLLKLIGTTEGSDAHFLGQASAA